MANSLQHLPIEDHAAKYNIDRKEISLDVGYGVDAIAEKEGPEDEVELDAVGPTHDADAQRGVQEIEALTSVWSKTSLVVAYGMIWIIYFLMLMQETSLSTLTTFVTSGFAAHSLTPTVTVVAGIVAGVLALTVAKILDVFGRPQGYAISITITTIGLIMMALCHTVETYAAADVFWNVGQSSMLYTLNIFIADTSALHNRGLMTAFSSSPNLITTWIVGYFNDAYINGSGWRWAFGTFAILVPVITLPLFGLFWFNLRKAKKLGVIQKHQSGRTAWQSFVYYCREFDAIGLLLVSLG
ncbi:hypothetical protein DL93DRAFT_2089721, partial [Clavulina sp. PMI_390]